MNRMEISAAVALMAVALAVPLFGTAYLIGFVFVILLSFILAQSWDWIGGEMGYVNLGHYVFYGIGAYVFGIALVARYPFLFALVAAVAIVMMAAALLSFPLFRLRGDYFAFGTLALLPLAEVLAYNLSKVTGGADGVVLPPANVQVPAYYLALGGCVLTFAVTVVLSRTRLGFAMKAVRNDEQVAEVIGVRIFRVKAAVIVASSAAAAFAGAVQSWQMSFIDPPTVFGLGHALIPVAMALLGGSRLLWGPLVGVILLSSLQQWLLVNTKGLQATVYGLVILCIGRFMPGGILRASWLQRIPLLRHAAQEHHARVPVAAGAPTSGLPLPRLRPDRDRVALEVSGLTMAFGGNVAVNNVNLQVREGEIIGLVGPNGSGKTTLFNCISKVHEPSGLLRLGSTSLAGCRRDEVVHFGVGRTYQIPRPFSDLTVQENVAIPLMFRQDRVPPAEALAQARAYVEYVGLADKLLATADSLSVQDKKSLELARALACAPKLLLVDELASGLTPAEVNKFVRLMRDLRDNYGITIIWVEHIFSALAQVVDRLVVLEQGRMIADGPLGVVVKDERVLSSYLGSMPVPA